MLSCSKVMVHTSY